MAKSVQKLQSRALRKQGKSLGEVAQIVGVAKSSVSAWCRDIALTEEQIEALIQRDLAGIRKGQLVIAEMRRKERLERVEKYQMEAFHDLERLLLRDIFMLGIGLYWAEGAKRVRRVTIANTDPFIINTFLLFLFTITKMTKLDLICHIQLNILHKDRYPEVLEYWMKNLDLTKDQFRKPTFIQAKHHKIFTHRETYYGVAQIDVRKSANLSYKIIGFINAVKYYIDQHARVAQLVRASHS